MNLPWLNTVQESLMTESSSPVLLASTSTVDPSTGSIGSLASFTERVSTSMLAGNRDDENQSMTMIRCPTYIAAQLHFTESKLLDTICQRECNVNTVCIFYYILRQSYCHISDLSITSCQVLVTKDVILERISRVSFRG